MDPVTHFEMPYDSPDRVAKFYRAAFGWRMQDMGAPMGNYVLAMTAESGASGRPKKGGTINGGFFPKRPDMPDHNPSVVIAVDDLVKSMAKVTGAGGRILGEPMDIPGIGGYVSFVDSEGNRVGMLQPMAMKAKAKAKAKPKAKAAAKKKKPVAKKKATKKKT
jgi:uncharacterized protein